MRNLCAALFASVLLSLTAWGQTNTTTNTPPNSPPAFNPLNFDWLTNFPAATNLAEASFGVYTGPMLKNGEVENRLGFNFNYRTNWMFGAGIENSASSAIIDGIHLFGGYRKAWVNAEIYGGLLVKRNWATDAAGTAPSVQGGFRLGGDWIATTGGRICVGTELDILTSPRGQALSEKPQLLICPFIKWHF